VLPIKQKALGESCRLGRRSKFSLIHTVDAVEKLNLCSFIPSTQSIRQIYAHSYRRRGRKAKSMLIHAVDPVDKANLRSFISSTQSTR